MGMGMCDYGVESLMAEWDKWTSRLGWMGTSFFDAEVVVNALRRLGMGRY